MAALPPNPQQASTSALQPTVSVEPSGRANSPRRRDHPASRRDRLRARRHRRSTPAAVAARRRWVINPAPVFSGTVCMRSTLNPGYRKPVSSMNGTPWRSASHSIAGPDPRATASRTPASASPWFLRRMSAASSAAESATPASRWNRVPAAGTNPDESAVEPEGEASRSSTRASAPASRAASAATRPQAPAPMTSTGARNSNRAPSSKITGIARSRPARRRRRRPSRRADASRSASRASR